MMLHPPRRVLPALILTLVATGSLWGFAPRAGAETKPSESDRQKAALVQELLQVTDVGSLAEKNFAASMEQATQQLLPMLQETVANQENLTPEQKAKAEKEFQQQYTRFLARFQKRFAEKINLRQLVEEVNGNLYTKYFTVDELRDILAFYRTATGKKSLTLMPEMMNEAMEQTNSRVYPVSMEIITELMQEELKQVPAKSKP